MVDTQSGIWDVGLTGLTASVALAGFLLAAFPASNPVNAILNTGLLILFLPPLSAAARDFLRPRT